VPIRLFLLTCILSLLIFVAVSGCNPAAYFVAEKIFSAHNHEPQHGLEFSPQIQSVAEQAYSRQFFVEVKAARLSVGVIEPGQYALDWQPRIQGPKVWVDRPVAFHGAASGDRAQGTVLLLHGFGTCKEQMLPWAFELANAGYRTVLVDLRGHGRSTGKWVGFGALEKQDLHRVVDRLEELGFTEGRLAVMGVSYGASVGLAYAAEDSRVATVVALEPFASAQEGIPELARAVFPAEAGRISDRMFRAAFAMGAARGGFDWRATNIGSSVARLRAPVLFLHGENDTWLNPTHSQRLFARAPKGSRLHLVAEADHVSLPLGVAKIAPEVRGWLEARLQSAEPVFATAALSDKKDRPAQSL
jgi:pimeloyl-ACP methyl ester carboxylesterase